MLGKKFLRTMKAYRAQFISMIIMVTLGTGIFIGFNIEWQSIESNVQYAFDETGFSDYRLYYEGGFSEADLDSVIILEGVDDGTRFHSFNAVRGNDTMTVAITTNPNVSGFTVMSGEGYGASETEGFWLSDKYAKVHGIGVGDAFSVSYKEFEFKGNVIGLIKSGEYLVYLADSTQIMPDFNTSGFCYISPAMFESVAGYQFYNQINVISDLTAAEFSEMANKALGKAVMCISKEDTVSYSEAMGEAEEGRTMAAILPVLFLAIATLTMITTMHRITSNEKVQVGILKALGFRDRSIKLHYVSYAVFIGVIGTAFGSILGFGLAYMIMNQDGAMGMYMDMPRWDLSAPIYTCPVLVLINLLLLGVGYLSINRILGGSAAEALRPFTPKRIKPSFIEKTFVWKKLGFGTRWNIRDTVRHKVRIMMTVLGVLGCVILLTASLGMKDTSDNYIDAMYGEAMNYETVIHLSPYVTNDDALAICEEYEGDWAADNDVLLKSGNAGFKVYSIENDHVRFFDTSMNSLELSDGGAYICSRMATDLGIGMGDSVSFELYGSTDTYSMEVIGVLTSVSYDLAITPATAEFFDIPYHINIIYTDSTVITPSPDIEATVSAEKIIGSFDSYMKIMNDLIVILAIAAVILGIIVLYNLGTLNYIERKKEIAMLKGIGYRDRTIGWMLVSQNIWMTVAGLILGIPLGIIVLNVLLESLASEYEMIPTLGPMTYAVTILVTFAVSLFVSLMITRNIKKAEVLELMRNSD